MSNSCFDNLDEWRPIEMRRHSHLLELFITTPDKIRLAAHCLAINVICANRILQSGVESVVLVNLNLNANDFD